MSKFRITYSKWLQTHSREHEEYQRRKRYNWGIISKIDFSPNNLKRNQEIRTKDTGKLLGHVIIKDCKLNGDRYVFKIDIIDEKNIKGSDFIAVFSLSGLPITFYRINDPVLQLKQDILEGNISKVIPMISQKEAKDILVEFVFDLLNRENRKFDMYKVFDKIQADHKINQILKQNGHVSKLKQKYRPEFSNERNHWLLVNVKSDKALSEAIKHQTQCDKITSIYLTDTLTNGIKIPDNCDIVSVFDFFSNLNLELYRKKLELLARLTIKKTS